MYTFDVVEYGKVMVHDGSSGMLLKAAEARERSRNFYLLRPRVDQVHDEWYKLMWFCDAQETRG